MSKLETRVIQVTNVAPTTTKEQLKTLFQFIGRIREVRVFPPEGTESQVAAKVCYIEFDDSTSSAVSLHLTNTVFIDRALMVVPVMDGKIPDDKVAMQLTPQTVSRVTSGMPAWPANVVSQLSGTGSGQAITTYDPRLNALGLPQYPPLPSNLDAAKVEEIRRTVYIGNLDPKTTPENLVSFFSQAGEVKYLRMAGSASAGVRAAYLELTDQRSVATALGYNGVNYNGRTITVSHSKASIVKPLSKSQEASRREVEEAMKKVKEAQSLISAAAGGMQRSRSRSRGRRSRSRGYSRSRSRSRGRRSRSRGRRRRSRSRSRRKSRSRSPRRRRSRSPRRRRSRSRSGIVVIPAREPRRRSKSRRRSRSRSISRRKSRTPPKAYKAGRSRSREATADKKSSEKRDRSKSPKRRKRSRSTSASPKRRRSISPRKRRSKSRSPRRSRSPTKKKKARSPRRSRSGSRHRSKKDKKKDRSRSRDRKDKKEKKKSSKDKKEDKDKKGVKVERNYDEEEKGFNSGSEREEEMRSPAPKRLDDSDAKSTGGDQMDMDTSD